MADPIKTEPKSDQPAAVRAMDVPLPSRRTGYPDVFAARVAGRSKHRLGDVFGLTQFGVNLTRLYPGAMSALRHTHARQDEFVYILEGQATLVTNEGKTMLTPGMCAGFKAGNGDAHHLINDGTVDVLYLEIGDRSPGDTVFYPDDDLAAQMIDGNWMFTHKDGSRFN